MDGPVGNSRRRLRRGSSSDPIGSPQALSSNPTNRHASCRRAGSLRMTATRAATDEADLTGADLTDLTGADLRSAKLDGADLRGAIGIDDLDI